MKYTYKITKANEWKNFKSVLITLFTAIFLAPILLYFRTAPEDNLADYWVIIPIIFLLFFIPLGLIHLRYYSINKGMEMIYDDIEKNVVIKDTKKNMASEFHLDDIKHIFHTMSAPMSEKRMHWFPWDSYNYSDIFLKDGRKFRITSLMVYRLELPVGNRYEVITSLYPYPSS
ncbi:MAG: hypothetical protein BGO09_09370 [Bacteroidetes bacterium 47-18]|nr:MAG: hypothetical protein BGO09_09370 [Bacteroidetes bacterium 47-18]